MHRSIRKFVNGATYLTESIAMLGFFILLILLASTLITVPLWSIALHVPTLFSSISLVLMASVIIWGLFRKLMHGIARSSNFTDYVVNVVWPGMRKLLVLCCGILLTYCSVVFFVGGKSVVGIIFATVLFIFTVIARNGRSREKS